jgi:hypothetical protein
MKEGAERTREARGGEGRRGRRVVWGKWSIAPSAYLPQGKMWTPSSQSVAKIFLRMK